MVDSGSKRSYPVCYVVSWQAGCMRDVTSRYVSNMISTQKHRDDKWWAETCAVLEGRGQQTQGQEQRQGQGQGQGPGGGPR